MPTVEPIAESVYEEYLDALFKSVWEKAPFGLVCSLLRVSGMEAPNWDPYEELVEAFEDYTLHLNAQNEGLSEKSPWRIGLLMYCQLTEMSAPHELLGNVLRLQRGENYNIQPFGHLIRKSKKKPFSWWPPSAKRKFIELKSWASDAGDSRFSELIDSFFSEDIRNSFSHSDYIITEDHYRWTEGGLPTQVDLKTLETLISNCFNFYNPLLRLHFHWLQLLKNAPRYHKWPNYEVLELLADDEHLIGFHVHFSNGSKAMSPTV